MKKNSTSLLFLLCLLSVGLLSKLYGQTPATLPYSQNFSTGNDLTLLNTGQTNQWFYGSVTGNPGGSLYISNDNGVSNSYSITAESVVQAYRDITIPAGTTSASFSFDWKGFGESTYDYLRVWLVPATFTPTPGVQIAAGAGRIQVGQFNQQNSWQSYSSPAMNISTFAGGPMRLVFEWRNDDIVGTNPPIAIDNISLFIPTCFVPSAPVVSAVTYNGATLGWTTPTTAPANGYEYYVSTTNTVPGPTTVGTPTATPTATVGGLPGGTTHYWWVRSVCSGTDKSTWVPGPAFTPGQIGTGTTTTGNLPVYSCFGYSYSQQIYTAAEVGAAVGPNNYITKIKFYVDSPATTQANYNQWVVYMGNTTQANYATTTSWVPSTTLTQVYSGTLPTMTAGTWVEIPLTTPFTWNGTGNIVIAVDENAPDYSCTANWGSYNAGTNRGILYYSDSTNPDPATPPTASSRYAAIPRVQFVAEQLQPCSSAPPANVAVSNVTATSAFVSWTPALGATYVVRYRVAPSGAWNTINITTPLVNNTTLINLLEQTTYEVQVATICGGTQGAFSSSVNFTTPAISYCSAASTSTTVDGYISNVTVVPTNSIVMSSNSNFSNYTDYSTDASRLLTLVRGSTGNQISVTKTWPGTQYSFGTGVWIDFNRNGTFEASEQVLTSPSNTTSPVTATFTVPTGAYSGNFTTRMRVVLRESAAATACGTFTWGEVEDYAVKLIDLQPCSSAPPTNITISNLAATTATVSWIPTTGATYVVRYRLSPAGTWTTVNVTTPPINLYNITGLTEQTTYDVQVATVCGGTQGAFSATTTFTTPALSYCNMTGTGTTDYISNVTVTSSNPGVLPMSNTSVQTNYISYTAPATLINLDIGSTGNTISVAKGWSGATYNEAVSAWIDYNRNGVFEASEQILNSPANTTTPVTNTFAIPAAGVYTGPLTTTMRVVLKRTSAPVLCQNAINGEVEDYAVRLRPCSNVTPNLPTFTVTHNSAVINWTGATNNLSYLVRYRVQGPPAGPWTEVYASTQLGNIPLNVSGLTPATTYEVQIAAVCGATAGTFTAVRTFTTKCDPTPPTVTITNVTTNSAVVSWGPIAASSNYILRYRIVGSTLPWTVIDPVPAPGNTFTLTNLTPYTTYEVQVANRCTGDTVINPYSNPKVFTTERTCELPPPGLTITNLTPTSAVVVWDPFPGATYLLRYRKVGIPSWTTVAVNTNTLTLTGLLELTKYEMMVANVCSGNTTGTFTQPYFFTTPTVIYCQMSSASAANASIAKVTVKPTGKPVMENTSGASTYTDYTGDPAKFIEMIQGSAGNEITIEKKLTSGTNAAIAVWIDFNRNGYFDINERVYTSSANATTPLTGTFTVPADAFISMTDYKYVVMRVALQKDGIPVNCTSFQDGEVEDYTVRISKNPVPNAISQTDIVIYPNPVSSVLYVKNISPRANYKIYNSAGQLVSNGIILNNKIDVHALINGVYVIDIQDGEQITVQKKFIKE
ncbi:fibronectin type III domain-containing protein [Chryseobacterium fluminis]|uniref:GEVED domain-containing protein n=1 Tax=Chryseobacterium fluminis TaxID=2983606 RepID=UPI0022552ADD|nr:fibronectin type III domain-containing protein [Chryseobacterium sp. MMS21-Ot14]UZT95897.1 fibronectin type III domain-containing protein [Chryseobacterium sp. MMS21-Ot14]